MKGAGTVPELCVVTVLSVDVVGSTRHIAGLPRDPETAGAFTLQCRDHVRAAATRAGGLLIDFPGDGGIALFGYPKAFEDHADRACLAAWDIQTQGDAEMPMRGPDGRPVQLRVGLHSGLVAVQRDEKGEFKVAGATVHIAAALQKNAPPDGVFVSARTTRLCRARLALMPQPRPSALSDLDAEIYSLVGAPQRATHNDLAHRYKSPIVGRAPHLATLRRALPRTGAPGCAIAIVGEPGIGKSRVAAAAIEMALTEDIHVLSFFGDAQKRTTPFAAAHALIKAASQNAGAAAPLEAPLGAARKVGRGKGGRPTQTQIARALLTQFSALALVRPLCVLIEDLHLIDPESRHFLRLLAATQSTTPLLLLLTCRPESEASAEKIAQTLIRLEPMTQAEMEALARQWGVGENLPTPLLEEAMRRADGVPFVLEELLQALNPADRNSLDPLPHGLESIIHARLNRLSPRTKATAQGLSLLGEEAQADFAMAVLARDADALERDLTELELFTFIHPRLGGSIRFRHQIIAEACASTISRQRRRDIHAAAVRAIKALHPDLSGRYERLAFHGEGAGDDPMALDFLWQAGLEARNNSAAASLTQILDHALELIARIGAPAEEKFVDFVLMSFASMLQLGEFAKMNALLPRTMVLALKQNRRETICGTMSQAAMVHWFEGRYAEGLRVGEEALVIARELNSLPLVFSTQLMVANILHGMGDMERAIATLRELCDMLVGDLETARLGAAAMPSSSSRAFMSWFLLETGQYGEALTHAERGLEIAQQENDAYAEVLARHSLGRTLLLLGRNADAVQCLTAALELSESNGYDAIRPHATGSLSTALARTGRASEAIGLAQACFENGLHLRTGRLEVYYLYTGYAEALFEMGETERSFAAVDHAIDIGTRIENPCLMVDGLGLRARLRARLGKVDARIAEDLAAQRALCERHQITAWADPALKTASLPA